MISSSVISLASSLRASCAEVDVASLSGMDAAAVGEALARTEKACGALRVRLAARVAACGSLPSGDAVDWLARIGGTSRGEAKAYLAMAPGLHDCPVTAAALAAGELSLAQAREIVTTEQQCRGSEADMVALAARTGLAGLREEGRRRRHRAAAPEDLHAKQHEAREVRTWRDSLGMVCLLAKLAPEVGVPLLNRLQADTDRIHKAARQHGSTESRSAHMADALAEMMAGGGKGHHRRAELVLVYDLAAWLRGHVHPGEVGHVIGGGPLPVAAARRLAVEAFVKAVLHDGVAIKNLLHLGRHQPAELRTALELGSPPDFDGVGCVDSDCDRRDHLEWDHIDPVAHHGPTSFDNLAPRCPTHHQEKTERDRAAGLLGPSRGPP